jgi:hypothetical protein
MAFLRNAVIGLRSLFRKQRVDRDLDEELRACHEMATEEKVKQGKSRKDALREVRLECGSVDAANFANRKLQGHWFLYFGFGPSGAEPHDLAEEPALFHIINSVTIIGFVGTDPEQRQAKSNGTKFTVLSVATQRSLEKRRRRMGLEDRVAPSRDLPYASCAIRSRQRPGSTTCTRRTT